VDLTEEFGTHRDHLRAVAYRMLGSAADADDAVQEAWLRLDRASGTDVRNARAWLTTVVARICLDILRTRAARREVPLEVPPAADVPGPEQEAELADSVGLALLVVLDTLTPAERLAFVLHDMFAVPFDDIGAMVGRTPDAARQLASRARRRVQRDAAVPDTDLGRQREVVDAFFAAARHGDFDALVAFLDPEFVLRSDGGGRPAATALIRGAAAVAGQALTFSHLSAFVRPALVNGAAGVVVAPAGRPTSVLAFTVRGGRIVEIDAIADPARLRRLGVAVPPA
jgi:RNA polymerase sigma-70 factor, ECF subfamily